MPCTVAVTGATGILGRHLVAALAREGAKIRILARGNPAHEFWYGVDFETISGSLEQPRSLVRLVTGADVVIHAAGLIKAPNLASFLQANRDGARAVAIATRQHAPAARFIQVSTLAAREPHISEYAFSKHAGEDAVRAVYMDAEQQLTIIRPPALYGPWDKATLAIFQAAALPFTPVFGRGRASVLHVTDAATALVQLALGGDQPGLFALPGGDYSQDEIMAEAARAQGRTARTVHIPAPIVRAAGIISGLIGKSPIFTAGKACELLHPDWVVHPQEALPYAPKISLRDGFAETVAWYRSKGWL